MGAVQVQHELGREDAEQEQLQVFGAFRLGGLHASLDPPLLPDCFPPEDSDGAVAPRQLRLHSDLDEPEPVGNFRPRLYPSAYVVSLSLLGLGKTYGSTYVAMEYDKEVIRVVYEVLHPYEDKLSEHGFRITGDKELTYIIFSTGKVSQPKLSADKQSSLEPSQRQPSDMEDSSDEDGPDISE